MNTANGKVRFSKGSKHSSYPVFFSAPHLSFILTLECPGTPRATRHTTDAKMISIIDRAEKDTRKRPYKVRKADITVVKQKISTSVIGAMVLALTYNDWKVPVVAPKCMLDNMECVNTVLKHNLEILVNMIKKRTIMSNQGKVRMELVNFNRF